MLYLAWLPSERMQHIEMSCCAGFIWSTKQQVSLWTHGSHWTHSRGTKINPQKQAHKYHPNEVILKLTHC